ncbi:hypothetical protein [Luteipulveratus mongoliensis]|uniref:Uncharacterized protein n=1 Tax=Luteipulveratus mongoliensis TaxID=571913 RepID=A0A0K1JNX0_9MICO|nr:hypothetical protein [Luteipulveratus mongoliensis]AKU18265.1 hypothetical protein VV02_24460 [Luteipulveratus mongoliensis]
MSQLAATATAQITTTTSRPWIVRRWPTWLAVAMCALTWGGEASDLAGPLVLLPIAYVVVAAARARPATWAFEITLIAAYIVLQVVGAPQPEVMMVAFGVVALSVGLLRGHAHDRRVLMVQGAGLALFAGAAFAALHVDSDLALWIVAGGWLAHGAWDAVHLRADAVVSRTYAEWCGVVDVLIALQLLMA